MSLKLVILPIRRVFVAAANRILVILVLMGIGRARVREKTARPIPSPHRCLQVSGSNDTPLGLFTRLPGWIAGMRMTWAVPDVGCEGKTSSRFVLISKEWSPTQLYAAIQRMPFMLLSSLQIIPTACHEKAYVACWYS
ncbi:hypothetical protein BDZ97DRAFT_2076741 [Flammula alnicola]|nr:hypothetical protein BDZ97DRAFT_2076741 [Flammula alnicola]